MHAAHAVAGSKHAGSDGEHEQQRDERATGRIGERRLDDRRRRRDGATAPRLCIDNSSAVAAAVKGYSYAADSARIVHGLHASLLALGVRAWFEYVRTDANVSDKPSREDLSTACYALGEVMGEAITASRVGWIARWLAQSCRT